jgi:aldehyde:ferredoxin oxidoreductase
MPFEYHGQVLHIDLIKGEIKIEKLSDDFYRRYVECSALGIYYLMKYLLAGIDPLDKRNILVISSDVMTGTQIERQSRFNVTAKSPLTSGTGSSQAGGYLPAQFKYIGFDSIVVQGKSPKLVYQGYNCMVAVMGSKNLKAIAIHGRINPMVNDQKTLCELGKWGTKNILEGLQVYGTSQGVTWQQDARGFLWRNFQSGIFEGAENISEGVIAKTIFK